MDFYFRLVVCPVNKVISGSQFQTSHDGAPADADKRHYPVIPWMTLLHQIHALINTDTS